MKNVSIAAIQSNCSANVSDNIEQTVKQIEAAAQAGAQLICLQELFTSLYFCQSDLRPTNINSAQWSASSENFNGIW